MPGKIPPACSLAFEVTLLWWKPPAVALTADGGILKTLRCPGTGPQPGGHCTVALRVAEQLVEGPVSELKILDLPTRPRVQNSIEVRFELMHKIGSVANCFCNQTF